MKKEIDDLYPEACDKLVGFKMTESEKKELEDYCANKKPKVKVSVFLRHVVRKAMSEK